MGRLSLNASTNSIRLDDENNVIKVCVIGAGFAGLSVAYHLLKHNKKVRATGGEGPLFEVEILEARDRIGGRVYPYNLTPDSDTPVICDLGGQWIHEAGPENPIVKLLDEINVPMLYAKKGNGEEPTTYSMIDVPSGTFTSEGTLIPNHIYRQARNFYNASRKVSAEQQVDKDTSFQDLLDQAYQTVLQKAETNVNDSATVGATTSFETTTDDDDDETETSEEDNDESSTESEGGEEDEDDDEASEEEDDDAVSISTLSSPQFVQTVHYFRHNTECYEGGRLDELSVALKDNYIEYEGADDFPKGGFHAVLKKLERFLGTAGNCALRLHTPAQTIHYQTEDHETNDDDDDDYGGVRIDYRHGNNSLTVNADCCVCTVPLGVLQKQGIEFDPPLPENVQESIDKIGMGLLDKIMLLFETQFWDEDWHGGITNEDPTRLQNFMDVSEDYNGKPILAMLLGGDVARRFDSPKDHGLNDEEVLAEAMTTLKMLFGDHIPHPIAFKVSRWLHDPYACGAYSFQKVGSSKEDYDRVAAPCGNNLFFAGEHTSKHHHSTVHGAWESGQREADRIIQKSTEILLLGRG